MEHIFLPNVNKLFQIENRMPHPGPMRRAGLVMNSKAVEALFPNQRSSREAAGRAGVDQAEVPPTLRLQKRRADLKTRLRFVRSKVPGRRPRASKIFPFSIRRRASF